MSRRRREDGKKANYPADNGPVAPGSSPPHVPILTVTILADRRRALLRLLDELEPGTAQHVGEGIARRIRRLSEAGVIPRQVAMCMRTITEMRNVAEYESKNLSAADTLAVEGAWLVIREWADGRGPEK